MKDYRIYWIWLASRAGQGSSLAVKLVNIFGNAYGVYCAGEADLVRTADGVLSEREIAQAKRVISDKSVDEAKEILAEATRLGQRVMVPTDADFPRSLSSLRNAPMVLYVMGTLPRVNRELCVSVVGTRSMSDAGRRNSYAMGYGLAAGGAVVVSGMALGCDGMALCGAVSAGGSTVAVLGGGVDVIYPKDHADLYATILKNGAVISEYPPGTRPKPYHFPVRNRIISGLSAGTVVVEADAKSGALISARHAIYQGRNVFAVPGEVGLEGSEGTNNLIKNGAYLATCAEDVLSEYEFLYPHGVSMKAYHRALRNMELDISSEEAMARLRISSKGGKNYYGVSAYGGKTDTPLKHVDVKTNVKVKLSDRKNASKPVRMGEMSESPVKTSPRQIEQRAETTAKSAPVSRENRIELDLLEEINIKLYNAMKPDVPMIPDELVSSEMSVSDVLSSLSMLELAGAVESYPGGYFMRTSAEDIVFDQETLL